MEAIFLSDDNHSPSECPFLRMSQENRTLRNVFLPFHNDPGRHTD